MIADKVRIGAYTMALRQVVKPGSVVIDIGTGAGIHAIQACQFGARRVYAIEPDDIIQLAKESAIDNGYAERIEFIQDLSTRATFPEQADVIVSDLRGVLPLFQHHIPSIIDARKRLLAPGGVLVNQRDTVWAAIVEAPAAYQKFTGMWNNRELNINMDATRRKSVNNWYKCTVPGEQLLVQPQRYAKLDYSTITKSGARATMSWSVAKAGTAHGLYLWFDAELADGVCFSNAPGMPELIYGRAFFPWTLPVDLVVGDKVSVNLEASLVGADYVWRWDSSVIEEGDPERIKASYNQSTFYGVARSLKNLKRQSNEYLPNLNENGQVTQYILSMMDGKTQLEDIARRVLERFPSEFSDLKEALEQVRIISKTYAL